MSEAPVVRSLYRAFLRSARRVDAQSPWIFPMMAGRMKEQITSHVAGERPTPRVLLRDAFRAGAALEPVAVPAALGERGCEREGEGGCAWGWAVQCRWS